MSTQGLSGGAFNFDTQADIAHVLASVRAANISTEQKNDLRDTIFLYTNGGRDQTVRIALEQKLVSFGIVPTERRNNAAEGSAMGHSRSAPNNFSVTKPVTTPDSTPQTSQATSPAPPPATPQPTSVTPASPTPVAAPPAPTNAPVAAPVSPQPAPATPQPATTSTSPGAVPSTSSPVTPNPISQPAAQVSSVQTPDVYLGRIREIKAQVNEKVGNPVNLVDIDNEVGREYMGALLDAMKKINSGASAVSAMQRLESALISVEQVIAKQGTGNAVPPATPQPTSVTPASPTPVAAPPAPTNAPVAAPVSPQPAPQPTPTPPPAPKPAPTPTASPNPPMPPAPVAAPPKPSIQTPPAPPSPPQPNSVPKPVPKPSTPPPAPKPAPTPTASPNPPMPPAPVAAPPKPSIQTPPAPPSPPQPNSAPKPVPKPPTPTDSQTVATPPQPGRVPLQEVPNIANNKAKESDDARWTNNTVPPAPKPESTKPTTMAEDLKSEAAAAQAAAVPTDEKDKNVDPLFTSEIDSGLDQLLSEWSLFKKSGLFGTGPKGREHPLFKKVAGLQIPLLLAGRFEGATQEIKQSITDYMNGWRYEQGIVYNQGETFERYLRRVIKHILDLQKKKTSA